MRRRGHRVVFIVEESFAGTLEAQGFEERLMRLTPPPETEEAPGQFWKDFIRDTAPVFRKPTIEQLGEFIAPTFEALIDGAKYVDARLMEILGELEPDLVVEDNVVTFPALFASGRPWARIDSCNPLEIKDPDLPPIFSGLPTEVYDVVAGLGGRAITQESLRGLFADVIEDRMDSRRLHFLDLDVALVERELARSRRGIRSGPHAENMLRDLGTVGSRLV